MENNNGEYLSLDKLKSYTMAFELSNMVWNIIMKWSHFEKSTVGAQFVRAVDSISANIAEGFGRYTKKDKIRFYIFSRGSVFECKDWNRKAKIRKLLLEEEYESIQQRLDALPKEINALIKYTNLKLTI